MIRSNVQLAGIIAVMMVLAACGANQAIVTPSPTAITGSATTRPQQLPAATVTALTAQALPTATPSQAVQPSTAVPADTPIARSLSAHGPWLVYQTDRGLAAVNADGTARTLLTAPLYLASDDLSPNTISSSGGWAALRVGEDRITAVGTALQLLHLPDGKLQTITPLLAPKLEKAIVDSKGDRVHETEAGIAVTLNDTARWSPDGRYLAFVGAMDGPSSDLYVFDVQDQKIRRLTDGPNQAAKLSWSPDGRWIVYEDVTDVGVGADYTAKAVWAATPEGSDAIKLYDVPTSSGDEVFVAWSTPDTFVVYTWTARGLRDARAINVSTGNAMPIRTAPYFDAFALDPQTGTAVYAVSDATARTGGPARGLYLESPGRDQPHLIDPSEWYDLVWSPYADQFFASGDAGILGIRPGGETISFDQEMVLPAVSFDGNWRAFWGDGYFSQPAGLRWYASDGRLQRTITQNAVSFATWSPDAAGIFYVSEGTLYYVHLPDGQPVSINTGVQASSESGMGWVP